MPARNSLKSRKIITLALVIAACLLFSQVVSAWNPPGGGNNYKHELMVYSIEQYGQLEDSSAGGSLEEWKHSVTIDDEQDPYFDFWNYMYTWCHNQSYCAKKDDSIRRRNSSVTVDSMVSMDNGWQDADMVFFFGHNTQIAPQNSPHMEDHHEFGIWLPDNGTWHTELIGDVWGGGASDFNDWGTSIEPYRYHRNLIDDASLYNANAVFYAYNPLTSVLIGEDFTSGDWYTENTWNQSIQDPNSDELVHDTEWIIAHGCSGVQTARYYPYSAIDFCTTHSPCAVTNPKNTCHGDVDDFSSGIVVDNGVCHKPMSSNFGVQAWHKSWGKLHTVLGHWAGIYPDTEPELKPFAEALKSGNIIKDAYFDIHNGITVKDKYINQHGLGTGQPSAISVASYNCCYWDGMSFISPTGGCGDYMNSETWTSPMSDNIVTDLHYYLTAYNVMMPIYQFLPITSSAAIQMLGANTIEKRAESFDFRQTELSYIHFASYEESKLRENIINESSKMLGRQVENAFVFDIGNSISISTENGMAFCAKGSGACTIKKHGYPRKETIITNTEDAVNRALDKVAVYGLLEIAPNETLDVISVISTNYAGVLKLEREFIDVHFETERGEIVPEYESDYLVTFGRRYNNVPIIGSSLSVKLDSNGEIVGFLKNWRDIEEVEEGAVDLLTDDEIEVLKDQELARNMVLISTQCGYFESSVIGMNQQHAGVGCVYTYEDAEQVGQMGSVQTDTVNISADDLFSLEGEETNYTRPGNPNKQYKGKYKGKKEDVD